MTTDEIIKLLPQVMQRSATDWDKSLPPNPMMAIIQVMCDMLHPVDAGLSAFEFYLDPRRAPEAFVPMLARWVDLDRLFEPQQGDTRLQPRNVFSSGLGRLRELIACATDLSKERGTKEGLIRFLKIATGCVDFTIEEKVFGRDKLQLPFHIRVIGPPEAQPFDRLIRRIIDSERPAFVTYEIEYKQESA